MKAEGDPAGKPTKEALIIMREAPLFEEAREPAEDTASRHSF